MIRFCINETQLRAALEELQERWISDGCHRFAIFELVAVGSSLTDCRAGFSGVTNAEDAVIPGYAKEELLTIHDIV